MDFSNDFSMTEQNNNNNLSTFVVAYLFKGQKQIKMVKTLAVSDCDAALFVLKLYGLGHKTLEAVQKELFDAGGYVNVFKI